MVKGGGGGIFSKFRGELAERGELKNSGGGRVGSWMKLWLLCYTEKETHFNVIV